MRWLTWLRVVLCCLLAIDAHGLHGDEETPTEAPSPVKAKGNWWAVIVCSHPGDEEHAKSFAQTVTGLRAALFDEWKLSGDRIQLLCDEQVRAAASNLPEGKLATRSALLETMQALKSVLTAEDQLWVIVVGHAHADGTKSYLNLRGEDLEAAEFGALFEQFATGRQTFWITTPASEPFVKPLSRAGRVIIAATEGRHEQNETLFPRALATTLKQFGGESGQDLDQDGKITLLDLYLATVRETNTLYEAEMALATEHAVLDDNGDGRATQIEEQRSPTKRGQWRVPATEDGRFAKQQVLR